jgi:hypothetical protein
MRTFIFIKNERKDGELVRIIKGMKQSMEFPSSLTRFEDSEFYGCQCIEVTEHCNIEIGFAE